MTQSDYHGAELVLCASCNELPERQGAFARCSSETCFLRSLIDWAPIGDWNELMVDVADTFAESKNAN